MSTELDLIVRVHREWNGWRYADVPLATLEDVHWFQPPAAPRPLVHAFVRAEAFEAEPAGPRTPARRVQVCVLKEHALLSAYRALERRAASAQEAASSRRSP